MKRFAIILFLILATAVAAMADDVSLRLNGPRQVIQGRKFTITLRLTNAQANGPAGPQLSHCKLLFGPSTSTMSSTSVINGQVSSSTTIDYTYTYLAEEAGEVTVPAMTVNANGKTLTSNTIKFTILPPDSNSSPGGNDVRVDDVSTQRPGSISANDMFVRISLNKSSVYEQEAIIATVKVYTKYNISSFRATTQPTFEGFLSEELDVPNMPEQEHYNGQNYTTAVLKRCILYPQKPGKLTVTSGKFEVTVITYELVSNGFFTTRHPVEQQVVTESNSASVTVKALPEPKPASFNGAVGNYTATLSLDPTELRTNEAASYVFTVKGTGNIKYLKAPVFDIPAGIDEFTPKTDIDARVAGGDMTGTYKVNYTLVPQEPGSFDIAPREFSYFNPSTAEYKTIDLPGFTMKVAQGASTSVVAEQNVIKKGIDDILHIKASRPDAQRMEPTFVIHSALYWLLFAACIIAFAAIVIAYRRQLRLNADVIGLRFAKAKGVASKRLKAAKKAMDAHRSDAFYQEINSALWGYLSDKLGIPASQLLRDNIAEKLLAYGASQPTVDSVISILDECEMARFTPMGSDSQMASIFSRASSAIDAIEKI